MGVLEDIDKECAKESHNPFVNAGLFAEGD
jgi:hypothetical protein